MFLLAVGLRLWSFPVSDRSPDEGLWTKFGAGIARQGPAWMTRQVHEFNRGADVEYPWQHRVGFPSLVALAMRASGDTTVWATEGLSTAASMTSVALTGVVALEFLGPWPAVVAMLFLATSPLDLAVARRGWQDDVVGLLSLLAIWAFLRNAARGDRGSLAAFFAVAGYSLIVKENAAITFGLGTLGLAWLAWRRSRGWRAPLGVLALGAATALGALAVVVAVSGGWGELVRTLQLHPQPEPPDEYMKHFHTGGVDYYVTGLWILQPVSFLLGAVAAGLAVLGAPFLSGRARRVGAAGTLAALGVFVLGFGGVAFAYYSKNLRFLSPLYAPVCLLAAALVTAGLAWLKARVPRTAGLAVVVVALGLAASATLDVRRFDHWFNQLWMQDLATPWFTQVAKPDPRP